MLIYLYVNLLKHIQKLYVNLFIKLMLIEYVQSNSYEYVQSNSYNKLPKLKLTEM